MRCMHLKLKLWMGALLLLLVLPVAGRLFADEVPEQAYAGQVSAGDPARLLRVSSRRGKRARPKHAAVSQAQLELSHQMVRTAYTLGRGLPIRRRVALMTRLLYTMRPEVMAAEKKEWAEELFGLAQQLPGGGYAARAAAPTTGASGYAAGNAAPVAGAGGSSEAESVRNAAIATAAARLAVYDADRALELLDSLPSQGGRQEDARMMAARLVFAVYMQHHGAPGAQTLLAHGRRWGEHGGFPYSGSAVVLGRLRTNEDAAEYFFRQVLVNFERGRDGLFGICDFASLLERAAAMEAISEDSAEEAGHNIVDQLRKLVPDEENQDAWTTKQKSQVIEALNNVRVSAPKAYGEAEKNVPGLLALRVEKVAAKVEIPKVDTGLQAAFHDLAEALREQREPEEMRAMVVQDVQLVNARYSAGECAECSSPDAQSWALISLGAYATPMTIATQLTSIEDPFWHAYFLAIAAQQVGEPTRVADPTRKLVEKEEAEPE